MLFSNCLYSTRMVDAVPLNRGFVARAGGFIMLCPSSVSRGL